MIYVRWGSRTSPIIDTYYTHLDLALALWGVTLALIFGVAQGYLLDWPLQAWLWSILSGGILVLTTCLAWNWVEAKQAHWAVLEWSCLIGLGLCLTDYGVFAGYGPILMYLCPLWLGICALGYLLSGLGMQAPALAFIGLVHLAVIPGVVVLPAWQFLLTGGVMAGSLGCLAVLHWDHQ